jgi:hypothetical protein
MIASRHGSLDHALSGHETRQTQTGRSAERHADSEELPHPEFFSASAPGKNTVPGNVCVLCMYDAYFIATIAEQ